MGYKKIQGGVDGQTDFRRASEYWDRGDVSRAYKAFLSLAKRGDPSSQLNVGYFFDQGIGVARNEAKALYWYRRAYARKVAGAGANIAMIFRDGGETRRAIQWFLRAAKRGDDGAFLEMAKIYLGGREDVEIAKKYLLIVAKSNSVSEAESEEAEKLLAKLNVGGEKPSRKRTTTRRTAGPSRAREK
jgi:TPR repeat protein